MEYRSGELLYVCKRNNDWKNNWKNGVFVLYKNEYKGDVDLSYHGNPCYEKFIVCEYLDSRDRVEFGSETWYWRSVNEYIKTMQNKL